jgi:hypothetical protein
MYFDFAGRAIANPAKYFVPGKIIQNDDIGLIQSDKNRDISRIIDETFKGNQTGHSSDLSELQEINVKYIVVLKTQDWREYHLLEQSVGTDLLIDSETYKIYRIKGAE